MRKNQRLCQIIRHSAAAQNHDRFYPRTEQTDGTEEFFNLTMRCGQVDFIPCLQYKVTVGDMHLSCSLHRADQNLYLKLLINRP